MTVIDLAARRAENTPHLSGNARCLGCTHEWVAVAPTGTVELECPSCGLLRGVFTGNALRQASKHWACACGNDLFHICPEGTYCPRCGSWQTGFQE